jgi:hypothetical protein
MVLLSQLIHFVLFCRRKELLHSRIHIHLHDQYSIPFPFPHCEKRAVFYNLNVTEVYSNFEKCVIHFLNLVRSVY